ncbi:hypothetical protein BV22DRAFT_1129079 [Leucogyrophana mollusca]|uniref:Uncharacterized protein n=1 Tax=Leucogyrophana mollusca TaxID=85980 RepID=A0ACB8BHZ1_9AGAM|nr:hypothetical protein BV22DRAFT_1129079 [Leucogyrophana mollusca]
MSSFAAHSNTIQENSSLRSSLTHSSSGLSLGSSNNAYIHLERQLNNAKAENHHLLRENDLLVAKVEILQRAFDTLTASLAAHGSSVTPASQSNSSTFTFTATSADQELDPELHVATETRKGVRYWTRDAWNTHKGLSGAVAKIESDDSTTRKRGSTRLALGENIACLYIEDKTGNPVSGFRAKEMRATVLAFFKTCHTRGVLAMTWYKMELEVRTWYYHIMRNKYPEFTLCANNWKADSVSVSPRPIRKSSKRAAASTLSGRRTKKEKLETVEIPDDEATSAVVATALAVPDSHSDSDDDLYSNAPVPAPALVVSVSSPSPVPAPSPSHSDSEDDLYSNASVPAPAPSPSPVPAPVLIVSAPALQPASSTLDKNSDQTPLVAVKNPLVAVKNPLVTIKNPLITIKNPLVAVKNPLVAVKNTASNAVKDPSSAIKNTASVAVKEPSSNTKSSLVIKIPLRSRSLVDKKAAVNPTKGKLPAKAAVKPTLRASKKASTAPMRVTKTINGRNVCARQWTKKHPKGTASEFKLYWDALSVEDQEVFDEKAASMLDDRTLETAGEDSGEDGLDG